MGKIGNVFYFGGTGEILAGCARDSSFLTCLKGHDWNDGDVLGGDVSIHSGLITSRNFGTFCMWISWETAPYSQLRSSWQRSDKEIKGCSGSSCPEWGRSNIIETISRLAWPTPSPGQASLCQLSLKFWSSEGIRQRG